MSRIVTRENMRHKDRLIDEGSYGPDHPIYSEGWTLGRPLVTSDSFKWTPPSHKKAQAEAEAKARKSKKE